LSFNRTRKLTGMRTSALTEEKIRELLEEDLGYGDITSDSLLGPVHRARATVYLKEKGVAAGLAEIEDLFRLLGCDVRLQGEDGSRVEAGRVLMEVEGEARAILAGERTALNILGRMSGIATSVAEAVAAAGRVSPSVRVAATRKTVPGLRELDKRAVELGGGDTHRFRLDDCVLIKDNHLMFGFTISEAVKKARHRVSFTKKIEIEVRTLEEAREAARVGADIIMFDNMSPDEIRDCLRALDEEGLRGDHLFEASGGITMENISEYAASGVDVVSMGSLTHSVRSLDVKLSVERA
jgi:nicotinate-nucleotide pyrophosphorylase (carboxylating)